jgi:hypothetical protein
MGTDEYRGRQRVKQMIANWQRQLQTRICQNQEPTRSRTDTFRQIDVFNSGKQTAVHMSKSIGRNNPCPGGSGKKYKRCCGDAKPPGTGKKTWDEQVSNLRASVMSVNPLARAARLIGSL